MLRFLKTIWDSDYTKFSLILLLCYVFANAAGNLFNRFDYVIILYVLCLRRISEENALQYSILFGVFYDLNYQIFIGLGILLFQLLSLIKIQAYLMIDMSKFYSRAMFAIGLLVFYEILTLKFFGYPSSTYWASVLSFFTINLLGIAVITLFIGGKRAFSRG